MNATRFLRTIGMDILRFAQDCGNSRDFSGETDSQDPDHSGTRMSLGISGPIRTVVPRTELEMFP